MLRRTLWFGLSLSLTLLAPIVCAQDPIDAPPNILLIVTDDMGYGDLSCYGSTEIETPAIDALAGGGIRCTQAYVTAPVCAPSRAGIMTGRNGSRFGFEHNLAYPKHLSKGNVGLPLDEHTIGDALRQCGYRTGLIGKWHLGEHADAQKPNQRGFDYFFGMLKGHHTYFPKPTRNQLYRNGKPIALPKSGAEIPYLTDWFTDDAIRFITRDGTQPWGLVLSYNTPHTPLQATPEDLAAAGPRARFRSKQRHIYCAMQHALDRNVAKLTSHLASTNQLDNTLIVFVNDNGGSVDASHAINAPLRGQKSTFLEGGIRVPMIFHWPNGLAGGRTFSHPVSTADLLPSFVAAANGTWPPPPATAGRARAARRRIFDGKNLLPFLRNARDGARPHRQLFWRMTDRGAAIRTGDWKLVRLPHRPPMLFDLAADVSELHDLAPTNPGRVREMLAALHDYECSLERPAMWISANSWARYNRKLYDREYALKQRPRRAR